MNWKEDDLALGLITGIENTTVFLELEDGTRGSMVFSEVAPGRIRNIREFVAVGKKIVCKVLRVQKDHLELSLRRVSAKERELVLEGYKKERAFESLLKPILKEKTKKVLEKIASEKDLIECFDKLKADPQIIKNYLTESELEQLKKVLNEKKEKEKRAQKKVVLKTLKEEGLKEIKEVLKSNEAEIHYLGSGTFSVSVTGSDFKKINAKLEEVIEKIQKDAKNKGMIVEIK